MKQFVSCDTNSAQKFLSVLKQFHFLLSLNFIFTFSLPSSPSADVRCGLYTGSLPENRAFALHYPTSVPAVQTFSHPVCHPLSMTQDTATQTPLWWPNLSQAPAPCSDLHGPSHTYLGRQSVQLTLVVWSSADPGIYVSTVFYLHPTVFETEL